MVDTIIGKEYLGTASIPQSPLKSGDNQFGLWEASQHNYEGRDFPYQQESNKEEMQGDLVQQHGMRKGWSPKGYNHRWDLNFFAKEAVAGTNNKRDTV